MRHSPIEFMRELAEENMRFWQNALNQPTQTDDDDKTDKNS